MRRLADEPLLFAGVLLCALFLLASLSGCGAGLNYTCQDWDLVTYEAGQYIIGSECTVIIGPLPDHEPIDPEGKVM